jgi:hypothetical protein
MAAGCPEGDGLGFEGHQTRAGHQRHKKTYEQIRFDEKFALGYFVEQCFGFVFNEAIKAKSGWR